MTVPTTRLIGIIINIIMISTHRIAESFSFIFEESFLWIGFTKYAKTKAEIRAVTNGLTIKREIRKRPIRIAHKIYFFISCSDMCCCIRLLRR